MKPRMVIVSFNANQPFSPRGERTRVLAEAFQSGWDVEVIAPPASAAVKARSPGAARARRRVRALADLFLLDKHELWSRRRFRHWRPDADAAVLIGYPFSPVSEAARKLSIAGIPYVVDAGDPWVLTDFRVRRFVGHWRSMRAERRVWGGAAGAILTTDQQALALKAHFQDLRVLTRPNGYIPLDRDHQLSLASVEKHTSCLRIVHFGNIYEPRADLAKFLRVLRASGRWPHVTFTLYGHDWIGVLERLPADIEAERKAPVPWLEAVALASRFDAALVLGNRNPVQLPSKTVQYLTLPIPRLAVVASSSEQSALAEYVDDKPGWALVGIDDRDLAARVAAHIDRSWTADQLQPPTPESWPEVAGQIVPFIENCVGLAGHTACGHASQPVSSKVGVS